jgi:hypothetical protein
MYFLVIKYILSPKKITKNISTVNIITCNRGKDERLYKSDKLLTKLTREIRLMKKLILGAFSALVLMLAIPAASFAATAQTDISGTVTDNGSPVKGADVTLTCNGLTRHTTTGGKGAYLFVMQKANCPAGSNVTVSATKSSMGGSNSGTVNSESNKLNVAIVNVSLPELGAFAAAGAAILGGGAFLVIRRHALGGSES